MKKECGLALTHESYFLGFTPTNLLDSWTWTLSPPVTSICSSLLRDLNNLRGIYQSETYKVIWKNKYQKEVSILCTAAIPKKQCRKEAPGQLYAQIVAIFTGTIQNHKITPLSTVKLLLLFVVKSELHLIGSCLSIQQLPPIFTPFDLITPSRKRLKQLAEYHQKTPLRYLD